MRPLAVRVMKSMTTPMERMPPRELVMTMAGIQKTNSASRAYWMILLLVSERPNQHRGMTVARAMATKLLSPSMGP